MTINLNSLVIQIISKPQNMISKSGENALKIEVTSKTEAEEWHIDYDFLTDLTLWDHPWINWVTLWRH